MAPFLFRIDRPGAAAIERTRLFDRDEEASAYARQLVRDWPDCVLVDVLQADRLIDRLRPAST
jgi:hypothetical protein